MLRFMDQADNNVLYIHGLWRDYASHAIPPPTAQPGPTGVAISADDPAMERALAYYAKFKSLRLCQRAFTLLENLGPKRYFDALVHTKDVMLHSLYLGVRSNLSERELELLAIASCWHELNFTHHVTRIAQPEKRSREAIAARECASAMNKLRREDGSRHYNFGEIRAVYRAIRDSELTLRVVDGTIMFGKKGVPILRNPISAMLVRADLRNLGGRTFYDGFRKILGELTFEYAGGNLGRVTINDLTAFLSFCRTLLDYFLWKVSPEDNGFNPIFSSSLAQIATFSRALQILRKNRDLKLVLENGGISGESTITELSDLMIRALGTVDEGSAQRDIIGVLKLFQVFLGVDPNR